MPVNYDLLTNELTYQGLADLNVLIEDTTSNSSDYFRVSKLPKEFTAGKNTFHFKGNPSIFKEGSYVYIEILDSNGQPLYYETALDLESADHAAIVTVHVNATTPPGTGYIILCSTIRNDINGKFLNTSKINLRWIAPIYINASKRNDAEIIFNKLPEVTITPSTSSYTNLSYNGGLKYNSSSYYNIDYYYYNNTPVLVTSSLTPIGFRTDLVTGNATLNSSNISNAIPLSSYAVSESKLIKVSKFNGSGIIVLDSPLQFSIPNSNSTYIPSYARFSSASINFEVSASNSPEITQNSNNTAIVFFSNLQPQTGEVAKIRSYYRSSGIGEYILSNETDITKQATEFGFNVDVVSASFYLPTIQRNDKLDFKFEFINPEGLASKQVVESLNNLFLGGNTYIGGDDNLLTGSLYVAGASGTGVHISGKGSASMIRSIGYTGFTNANPGFVMYSGSVQSLLGASENYSGVGLELYANTGSYFKYTTSGSGLLDIRTSKFFIGNDNVFLSSSNNNLEIKNYNADQTKTYFHLDPTGNVTASAFIAVTGSDDTHSQFMMNTAIGLTDGKNIGRIIYHQTDTISVISASSEILNTAYIQSYTAPFTQPNARNVLNSGSAIAPRSNSWLAYQPIISDLSYYSLPFENTITIFGNVYVDKYTTGSINDDVNVVLALRFSVWRPVTSSYEHFGLSGNVESASGDYGFVNAVSGTMNSGSSNVTYNSTNYNVASTATIPQSAVSGAISTMIPFKAVINIPSGSQDLINTIDLDYAFFKMYNTSVPPGTDFTFRAKFANFSVMSSRLLASNASSGTNLIANDYPNING